MTEILITSSVLICGLLLLRLLFVKKVRRGWIYAAWLLVALRLLIPVQIGQFSFSLLTAARPLTEAVQEISVHRVIGRNEQDASIRVAEDYIRRDQTVFTAQARDYIREQQDAGASVKEIAAELVKIDGVVYMPEVKERVTENVAAQTSFMSLGELAHILWLVGIAGMVLWLAAGNLLLRRSLMKTETALECGSPIPVYVSEAAVSPCLVGLFRPAVYLPPQCANDEGLLRHVLAHELAHFAHRDHIWAFVRCVCLCVYWFDPLVWAAASCSRRDCELACDEAALLRLGEDERIAYGKSLLLVISQTSPSGHLMLTATTMAESKKQLKERVNYIAKKQKLSVAATVVMLLVCVLITGCVASGPANTTDPADKKPWEVSEEVKSQLKQDYVEYMSYTNHSCTAEDYDLVVISQVDTGYALVIGCLCSSVDVNASWQDLFGPSYGDLTFYMPNGWFIQFYKDGEFRTLNEAFNLRWIDYTQLRTIWDDYYAQFPKAYKTWQKVYGGMEQPPERDPSGLDYAVNADGLTCTVTGMGVCNDTDVVIPEYIDGYHVTAIGGMAFLNSFRITSVTMPDSVVSIGYSAFEDCEQLKSITLSASLKTIGIHAFRGCKALETVSLPDSLTLIDGGAFIGCSALTEVTIPESVTSISSGLFRDCKKLTNLNLPGGLTDIGKDAFGGCPDLVTIRFHGTTAQWEAINQMRPWYEGAAECRIHCSNGQIVENKS